MTLIVRRILVLLIGAAVCAGGAEVALAASQTVREPAFGLPHVYADTTAELAREAGYQVAKDRLGQIILFARASRGTLFQAFGLLAPSLKDDDIQARLESYSSAEYVEIFNALPSAFQNMLVAYADGVNDAIDDMFSGALPKPLELSMVEKLVSKKDIFGNRTELTLGEGRDPFYKPPCPELGCDASRPSGGYQYTPILTLSIAVLQIHEFGRIGVNQPALLEELEALKGGPLGAVAGEEVWDDLNFLNDPLSPVSVPDPRAPGFGGPLAKLFRSPLESLFAWARAAFRGKPQAKSEPAVNFARRDLSEALERFELARAAREERAKRLNAWVKLGSYAWVADASRSATGRAWLGGFPQMGFQNPSIMHFMELHSPQGTVPGRNISAAGMELPGGALVLIGHTDQVAWTLTTAPLGNVDYFVEELVNSSGPLMYNDEGTPAPVKARTEIIPGAPPVRAVIYRTHERTANGKPTGGDRFVVGFQGDFSGKAESGSTTTIVDTDASFTPGALVGGYVAINQGTNAGTMRQISANTTDTITVSSAYAAPIDGTSEYTAVLPGNKMALLTQDSSLWREESTSLVGWRMFQEARSVLDVRKGARMIPATFNMVVADNQPFNGEGTDLGSGGNILYLTAGFLRKRQNGLDRRLPLDGTESPNPFVVVGGAVQNATDTTLTDPGAFASHDFSPEPINFSYNNPGVLGSDYIVTITAGNGYRQSRRIASNTSDTLTLEQPWGRIPSAGDLYEIYEIIGMPEAMNPAEGYTANWNNKPSVAVDFTFGRQYGNIFMLERLSTNTSVTREDNRQLNKDVAGIVEFAPRPKVGRYLLPRVRQAFDALGDCTSQPSALATLSALEAHNDPPFEGREFVDPVNDTERTKAVDYLLDFVDALADAIYADEIVGLAAAPGLDEVIHAIDSAAGDVSGSYVQKYSGDYFNGADWREVVRDTFCEFAEANPFPTDTKPRGTTSFNHLLSAVPCNGITCPLEFPSSPRGNRGTWEQIIEVGPSLKGEFIFPLGQSGLVTGVFTGVAIQNVSVDRHATDLHPIWNAWRFVPILRVAQDLAVDPDGDLDGDGVLDGYERWYYDNTGQDEASDTDADGSDLLSEFFAGTDPTDADTDDDGLPDGLDLAGQGTCPAFSMRVVVVRFKKPSVADDTAVAKGTGADAAVNPLTQDTRVVLTSGGEPLIDVTIPAGDVRWRVSPKTGTPVKFRYVDKDGLLGGLVKLLVKRVPSKDELRISLKVKGLDVASVVTSADAHLAVGFGGARCTEGEAINCALRPGRDLKCKQ